jgi:hypothetical protein
VHIIYIDESADESLAVISALAIPADQWWKSLKKIVDFRRELRSTDGLYVKKELHANKFVPGRGRPGTRIITKYRRSQIFTEVVKMAATLPEARLFNATAEPPKKILQALERLLNRINRTMQAWHSLAILICDEGKETAFKRMVRQMRRFNPVPSQFGVWLGTDELTRNIPTENIIEDPVFKKSEESFFIQLVDFIAYALLRRERPIPSRTRYDINKAFDNLRSMLVTQATRYDPEGIVRVR